MLVTRNTTVGGSQREGINYQTTFQLWDGSSVIGQVSADNESRIVGRNVSLGRLKLITRRRGEITFENATTTDQLIKQPEGGPIRVIKAD